MWVRVEGAVREPPLLANHGTAAGTVLGRTSGMNSNSYPPYFLPNCSSQMRNLSQAALFIDFAPAMVFHHVANPQIFVGDQIVIYLN